MPDQITLDAEQRHAHGSVSATALCKAMQKLSYTMYHANMYACVNPVHVKCGHILLLRS